MPAHGSASAASLHPEQLLNVPGDLAGLSADGRYALVADGSDGSRIDRISGALETFALGPDWWPIGNGLTSDGDEAIFQRGAGNPTAPSSGIFAHDFRSDQTTRIAPASTPDPYGSLWTFELAGVADGGNRILLMGSNGNIPESAPFAFDRDTTGATEQVDTRVEDQSSAGESSRSAVSTTGRYVVFVTEADNVDDGSGKSIGPGVIVRDHRRRDRLLPVLQRL